MVQLCLPLCYIVILLYQIQAGLISYNGKNVIVGERREEDLSFSDSGTSPEELHRE